MEKKIFVSRGIPKKQALMLYACSVILAVGGSFFIMLSNARRKGISVRSSFGYGTIGGGYVLNDEGRKVFLILGVVLITFGIGYFIDTINMQKSVFTIYEDHIDGLLYVPLLIVVLKKEFHLEYDEILEVQLQNSFTGAVLRIVSQGGKYGVLLKSNGKKELAYIKQKMKGAS